MIHSSDKEKDFIQKSKADWTGKDCNTFVTAKCYKSDDLQRNGFIHQDGSLRFEFEITRKNYRTKNKEQKKRIEELTATRIYYESKNNSLREEVRCLAKENLEFVLRQTEQKDEKV